MDIMRRLLPLLLVLTLPAIAADKKEKDPEAIGERNVSGRFNNFYSLDKEIALGRQLSLEVRRQARIVDDPIVAEYINRLGQNLARNSDVTFPVTFTLIDSDDINAFTLPGGFVFINTGMFRLSDNEAELASVIAHELGHAAARHATRQATRADLLAAAAVPMSVFGGWIGLVARPAMALVEPAALFHFSREFEIEADLLGIQYLWKAGYDPNASVEMFERVESTEKQKPGSVSRLFRTHPLTADRIAKTQANIDALLPGRDRYVLNTSEYEDVRARLSEIAREQKPDTKEQNRPTLMRAK
jgi:predicted Zn-dependent protease